MVSVWFMGNESWLGAIPCFRYVVWVRQTADGDNPDYPRPLAAGPIGNAESTEFLQAMTQSIILKVIESCLVNWICNAIIGAAYPPINEAIGGNGMIIKSKRWLQ